MLRPCEARGLILGFACAVLLAARPALPMSAPASDDRPADPRFPQALKLHDQGDYDGAIAVYQQILADRPNDTMVAYEWMFSTYMKRDFKAATTIGEATLKRTQDVPPDLYVILGSAYDDSGDVARGEQVFRDGLDRFPEFALLHYNLGVNMLMSKRFVEAAKELSEDLLRQPEHASGWLALAETSTRLGRRADAVVATVRFLTLEPESPRAATPAASLWGLLFSGVEEKPAAGAGGKNEIHITLNETPDEKLGASEVALSLAAAQRYLETWRDKSAAEFFPHGLDSALAILSESSSKDDRFWQPCALAFFDAARSQGHMEALAYDIRRSTAEPEIVRWLVEHAVAVERYRTWARGYRNPACSSGKR
jgi:tetratricopeptide (TPR) repeat protein